MSNHAGFLPFITAWRKGSGEIARAGMKCRQVEIMSVVSVLPMADFRMLNIVLSERCAVNGCAVNGCAVNRCAVNSSSGWNVVGSTAAIRFVNVDWSSTERLIRHDACSVTWIGCCGR